MPVDPRTPVLVGVGQSLRKPTEAAGQPEPVDMMVDVLRLAADDAGAPDLLRRADAVRVVDLLSWPYRNAPALVAERVGASSVAADQLVQSTVGGNSPQSLVNEAAMAIGRGDLDVVLIAGVEAIYTRMLAGKAGVQLDWTNQDAAVEPPRRIGIDRPGTSEAEAARSLMMPTQVYPIFENALRAAAGESFEEHQAKIAGLWSRFSAVAAQNPYAWSPEFRTPDEIATVDESNRMIGFPYPKLMNANIQTDQAAALILCSVEAARTAGVPEEKWVFPWAGADAHDHWFISERESLAASPAIFACGQAIYDAAGRGPDDIGHIDLYSCFPSAVQIGAAAMRLPLDDPDRPLTVTGGLTFAGGPGNNYVTHSIATMADVLRRDPGSLGLVTALGWYITKHAAGMYSTDPPPHEFVARNVQEEVDAQPRRSLVADYEGPATIESFTVTHERDGSPSLAIIACLTPDGDRTWVNSSDSDVMKTLMSEDVFGRRLSEVL